MTQRSGKKGLAIAAVLAVAGCGEDPGETVLPGVEALVFVQRAYVRDDLSHDVTGGNGQTMDYLRYVPGGGVFVLEPPTPSGTLRNLTADAGFEGVDVNGIDTSFDGTQVVFSMRHAGIDNYDIFLANIDGSGDVRQLTFNPADDVMPVFLAGDRIAFVTNEPYTEMGTRADEYNHGRTVSQLATISVLGGDSDRRLCSQNLSNTVAPFAMSDGTIGFSRWEHLAEVNDLKLFHMNPDCTNMTAIAGQFNKSFNSVAQAQEIARGRFIAIGTSREGTIQSGALFEIDARGTSENPDLYIDVQQARFRNLTPLVPTGMSSPPSGVGRYRNPRAFDDDHYIVSWADGDVNERNELSETAPNFGIYLFDAESGERTLVYDNPEMWDLYAIPVRVRPEPPVIRPSVEADPDVNEPAVLSSIDITQTSLDDTIVGGQFGDSGIPLNEALGQAVRMRIIEGFSSEIGPVGQFGLTMSEGAAILGETPVFADGSWRAAVPAYLPYHLQPIDRFGMSIRNQRLWIQAMPGENRTCGGCHESRSAIVEPRMGATTLAQQAFGDTGDMSTFRALPERTELPWYGAASRANVQEVFDRNCVSCHAGQAGVDPFAGRFYTVDVTTMEGEMLQYQIPYLDLSDRMLEVYYEDEVVSYPASYITTLYPSAMMGDSVATGDVPPMWIIPSAARESALIRGINVASESDATELAWGDRPMHPEDLGVDVSAEDREVLIRAADLGGQYYSRWNVMGGYNYGSP
jgi:hypothetical protein